MNEKKECFVLDDSFDGLDEKIVKRIIQELEEMSYEEVLNIAKKENIDISVSLSKGELIQKITELLSEDE